MDGKTAHDIWESPKRAAQKDTDARWTIKFSRKDDAPKGQVDIAIPSYGYKSHVMIDRARGFIRHFTVTDASRHDGAQLDRVVRRDILANGGVGRQRIEVVQERGLAFTSRPCRSHPEQEARGAADA